MTRKDAHLQPRPITPDTSARRPAAPRAFTLIELLVVIAIIGILTVITVPAIKSLSKSNDTSQATNVIRSLISNARSIAISQHRMAGIVFFEEGGRDATGIAYSSPIHGNQTAMQIFVESYDQTGAPPGTTGFLYYSTQRQYLPNGIRLASLTDDVATGNVEAGDNLAGARAILFDANGDLVLRGGLFSPAPPAAGSTVSGSYNDNSAYGDWKFDGTATARSYPGFFVYNKAEYLAQPAANRASWLKNNSTAIIVNANTGGVLR